jgi:AcrR family transcriptional regulator
MSKAKTRVREDPVVRRAQIVDEGIRIIGEKGYNGFTVQALAERCGLSNAGLLHYFESKDRLLLALLDEIERREMDAVSPLLAIAFAALEAGDQPNDIIYSALEAMICCYLDRPEIGRFITVLQAESLDPSHPAHSWFEQVDRETRELFERLISGLCVDPEMKSRQLFALFNGISLQWFRADRQFDIRATWAAAIRDLLPQDGRAQKSN